MKIIKLLKLKLVNFKGVKEFEFNFAGNDANAFGKNESFKTTLFDGFLWSLFDTDSLGRSTREMGIKTIKNEKVIHKLDHEVETTLLVDDAEVVLRKVYSEVWSKIKGSNTESFTGHTTDHFINGVPSKKGEYEDYIKEIVDKDVFKLLTSPFYFNEQLHWKERRDLVIEVAGGVEDSDIFAANKDLAELEKALNGNSIEDHQKIIAAKRRDINKEIEKIPVRVDEIHRNLPDISDLDEKEINSNMATLLESIDKKHEQINGIESGAELNELKKQISDIELKISGVRNEHTQKEQEELYKLKAKLQEEQSNLRIMRGDISSEKRNLDEIDNQITKNKKSMDDLRADYTTENSKEFTGDHECPTCTQPLPADQIEKAKASFNRNKARTLEAINKDGIKLKEEVEQLQVDKEKHEKEIAKITENGKKKASDIEKLEKKIKEAEANVRPIEENEQYIKLNDEKKALRKKVEHLDQSVSESVQAVQAEIEKLEEQRSALQVDLSKLSQVEQSKKRINELEEQEEKLATEYEQLEKEQHLTEEFTRIKVNMLTEKINSKFKHTKFNLFRENINGGLEEVCQATYKGVAYNEGLNLGGRINIGLDIINTLSEHYGIKAPIFIDNAESVSNFFAKVDSQTITLVVSKEDEKLRIETAEEKESEVA